MGKSVRSCFGRPRSGVHAMRPSPPGWTPPFRRPYASFSTRVDAPFQRPYAPSPPGLSALRPRTELHTRHYGAVCFTPKEQPASLKESGGGPWCLRRTPVLPKTSASFLSWVLSKQRASPDVLSCQWACTVYEGWANPISLWPCSTPY